jgi:hypothetical protein
MSDGFFLNDQTGWLCGVNGVLLKTSTGGTTSVFDEIYNTIPQTHLLEQNYPNPFNPVTTIRYSIPNVTLSRVEGSRVLLKIYDILGNEVATLVDEYREAGNYEINFNASGLASGMYLYRLQTGNRIEVKKMTLLK